MKIEIIVYTGADEIDCIAPYEVFSRAALLCPEITVSPVTLQAQAEVRLAYGLKIRPEGTLSGRADIVLVPGGGWLSGSESGVRAEIARGELVDRVRTLHNGGATIAGVCSGTMVLSAAGLLDGRPAITHRGAVADLCGTLARVLEHRVVDDGDIVTCGGVTSSFDLGLWLVERFYGAEIANKVAAFLEYPRSSDIYVSHSERVPA